MSEREAALRYHRSGRPGKIEVTPTKPLRSERDFALATGRGVVETVRMIAKNSDNVDKYTARANLVAVLTNGSAILGLGNLGPLASKPVMEGKSILFKRFADIDVFDIEVDSTDPDEIIRFGEMIAPTFGGINLEGIQAPDCFYIEQEIEKRTNTPIFHDDQHGTAIVSGAALLNALEIVGKRIQDVQIVINGAGAAGIASGEFYTALGAERSQITLCDSHGVVWGGREVGMNSYKARFARSTSCRTLSDAMNGADVLVGVSMADVVEPDMLRTMADQPIVFALANPDPGIAYESARNTRTDVILATGRSDFPNQINSVLCFPSIFRGALDARATHISTEMKVAAAHALASLAKEIVPETVLRTYGIKTLRFGPDYLIPKLIDPRVLTHVASAVARAAVESRVARVQIDFGAYAAQLVDRQDADLARVWNTEVDEKATSSLSITDTQLREADDRRALDFLSISTHEIIAPLLGATNALEALRDEQTSARTKRWLKLVAAMLEDATLIASSVYWSASLEFGESPYFAPNRRPVDLRILTQEMIPQVQMAYSRMDIEFVIDIHDDVRSVNGDLGMIKSVLYSLMSNATKYSDTHSSVIITMRQGSRSIVWTITSRGILVRPNEILDIFRRGYRGSEARQRYASGSGLGLWTAKQLTGAMGGSIHADVDPKNQLITFVVELPIGER